VIIKDSTVETATTVSQLTLQALEQIVERGKDTFIEVGKALAEIHERKLYKETHKTWEAYLKERWNFSRQHAHRILQAKKVAEMSPMGDKPKTEREARARIAKKSTPVKPAESEKKTHVLTNLDEVIGDFRNDLACWEKYFSRSDLLKVLTDIKAILSDKLCDLQQK